MNLSQAWPETVFVAFDLETSTAYPVGGEIIEIGAQKWQAGRMTATYQTLLRPQRELTPQNIKIHGITNEMLVGAPNIEQKISEIRQFFGEAVLVAHHAPFDMGFLAYEFEKFDIDFPLSPVVCSSLLSRAIIPESPNHRLQTLISFLNLNQGTAHRGLDDAIACMEVALECFRRLGPNSTLEEAVLRMGKNLQWKDFSILRTENKTIEKIRAAVEKSADVEFEYVGGSVQGQRRATPLGIVRNPNGDYFQGICHIDKFPKRFYFDKITTLSVVTN